MGNWKAVLAIVLLIGGSIVIYYSLTKEQRQRDSLIAPRTSPMSELAESHDPRNWDRILASAEGVEIQRTLEFERMLGRDVEAIVLTKNIDDPRLEYLESEMRHVFQEFLYGFASTSGGTTEDAMQSAGVLDHARVTARVRGLASHSPSFDWRKIVPRESRIIIGHAADTENEVGDRLGTIAREYYNEDVWYLILEYRVAGEPGDHATHLIALVSATPGEMEWVGGISTTDGGLHFLGDPPANLRPSSP